ncbi:NACHT, LRR and PYD domains-containing protein 3-like [Scomber scombrus]|uniref:NACHT, LRR and PYD domains-containing protein 3-like n=1 Tax=Scomber scombrus TaxID=13677 RepID=UPI002DDB0240|nr:NACHT, LRR and PYD domains-containing protein 3-like [Scomber scombrus]XP_062296943.1 NACHT, LRR and PYD domains-containing protein 3-like [Scomber scombrus]XP_062296951.1 NACHT, LRR and PYD domains-containing protein 3-like [Scomber scombrus]
MERKKVKKKVKGKVKAHVKQRFTDIFEGTSASLAKFKKVYTRLYITQQGEQYGCQSHEFLDHFKLPDQASPFSQINYQEIDCMNIFKPGRNLTQQQPVKDIAIKRVMTSGIAGIGKTVAVQNFSLDWAEGKSNQNIDFVFVLPFRELNMLKGAEYSLMQLLLHFYPELKPLEHTHTLVNEQVLLIFDGLDESRFTLDFDGTVTVSDEDQRSTVDVLLTNLIKGNLLPNALLWITSRPAAISQIPSKYIDQMTEVQGFTDKQKEEYFTKRFSANQIKEILSCLRGMISFCFMGHIPIFCWVIAEVFQKGWDDQRSRKITTMTELYISYLLTQKLRTTQKYGEKSSESQNGAMLLNLSKLAFEQLQKGNIIFYEEDLRECDIDVDKASMFCGFCSEILREERGLYQKKMFSFVHLSFQEFLAALHMFHSCVTKNMSTLKSFLDVDPTDLDLTELQKRVVDKALQSEKGQLDMFLCFFLGFTLESNQTMLQGLLPQIKSSSDTVEEMKKYLQNFHAGNIPQERCMNLFLCKYELKEERFQHDIRRFLSGARLSPIDCSVISTMLQISGELIDELDLTKCWTPHFCTEKLILPMKNCKRALLTSEHLREKPLRTLLSILQSPDSCLRELCLDCVSNINIPPPDDLFDALGSPNCKLKTLRLSGFSLDFRYCHMVTTLLQLKQSSLRALDLTDCIYGYPEDYSGYFSKEVEKKTYEDVNDELTLLTTIPAILISPVCKLEEFSMRGCLLKSKCCQVFASVLCSNSQLRELDISRNDLQDLGVQLLSVGLGSLKCRLQILRLSCCGITEEGCASLASALKSNPSHLRELDLSYNHLGESGVRLLSERLEDPKCRLAKLSVDHDEEHWVNPQLLNKYACELTFDPNTVNEHLVLSESNNEVKYTAEKQLYPDHPERFDQTKQVLCREGLTGRCYWEVEWDAFVNIGVVYKSLQRKGWWNTEIDRINKAWCFTITCSKGYTFCHGLKRTFIPVPIIDVQAFLARPKRLGLFLDWPAGVLSFYWLSGDTKTLLHTFHATFTEPLHPVFMVNSGYLTLSSVVKPKMDPDQSSFIPEVTTERIGISYKFIFPGPGLFRCSLTGLVFNVTHEGEVRYRTLIWDNMLLQPALKVPAGPLFSIECAEDSIRQLHLPHCEPEPALVSESLSVVNISDDGMSIIQPLEVTETHVVVDIPHLSAFGIIWDLIKRFCNFMTKPISGQVLLFLRRPFPSGKQILSVILLPSNVPLLEVKVQHTDSQFIQAPSNCLIHREQRYSLLSDPDSYKIQPDHAVFSNSYGPNYHPTYEIMLRTSTEEVTLMLRDPESIQVWQHNLHLPVSSSGASSVQTLPRLGDDISAEKKLLTVRSAFIYRVSYPVLDNLLDKLLAEGVITDAERETAMTKPRQDKARDVIDIVRKKGRDASEKMMTLFSEDDTFLCRELGLI